MTETLSLITLEKWKLAQLFLLQLKEIILRFVFFARKQKRNGCFHEFFMSFRKFVIDVIFGKLKKYGHIYNFP